MLRAWRAERRADEERRVVDAIGMLRPSRAGGYPISRLARLSLVRTYAALERLQTAGRVTSEWTAGPKPRIRVYRVVREDGDT